MADEAPSYRERSSERLRVLFCFGVTQTFFDLEPSAVGTVVEAIRQTFADLRGRFGVEVLGTLDDDELMVGASPSWPWTAYILADVPDLETVRRITNLVREHEAAGHRLWRYLRIEARVGRELFFGNA
jgi:hypothetical protein